MNSKENTWFSSSLVYNFNSFRQRNEWNNENILLKGVTKTIKNKTKEQTGGFLCIFFCTLGASLLGNILVGKEIVRVDSGRRSSNSYGNKKGKGNVRTGYGKEWDF